MALLQGLRLLATQYPNAKLFSYAAGTTNKQDIYTTSALNVAHSNPLSADANGLFASIYLDPAKSYKFVLAPSTDTDPRRASSSYAASASAGWFRLRSFRAARNKAPARTGP